MNTRVLQVGEAVIAGAEWSDDPLERLTQMQGARNYLDAKIDEAVHEARTETRYKGTYYDHVETGSGVETRTIYRMALASWQQVADALGMSRQGAHKKFAHLMDEA